MMSTQEPDVTCCSRVKKMFSLTKPNATPIRWDVLFLVVLALFSSSYAITFLFPFLPEMILFFGYKEEEKGYYAGLVASAMFAGRIFGSYFWGWLSDKKGRKPIILFSTVLIFCTNIMFGFSTNIYVAVISRFLNGLFNGVIACCKVILYEISDNTNQGGYMAPLSLAFGGGAISGPLISGYLASPAKRYPGVFSADGVFGKFPYLLPSLMASFTNLLTFVFVSWKLPETRRLFKKDEIFVESPQKSPNGTQNDAEQNFKYSESDLKEVQVSVEQSIMKCRTNVENGDFMAEEVHFEKAPSCWTRFKRSAKKSKLVRILRLHDARMAVAIYTLTSVSAIGYDEVFTVFASTDRHLGGMGFEPEDIGKAIGLSSIPLIVLQVFLFPFLEVRLGAKKVFCIFTMYLIFASVTMPSLRVLHDEKNLFWTLLLCMMGLMKISQSTIFSANGLHINNSVPPEFAGTVNGLAMTATSIGRTLAPILGGSIFAWTVSTDHPFPLDINCAFILFGVVYLISNIACALIPGHLDKQIHKKT